MNHAIFLFHRDGRGFDLALKAMPLDGEFSLFLPTSSPQDVSVNPRNNIFYDAYIVEGTRDDEGNFKNYYHRVGVAFPHANGRGFNVSLFASPNKKGLKLVIREPRINSNIAQDTHPKEPIPLKSEALKVTKTNQKETVKA